MNNLKFYRIIVNMKIKKLLLGGLMIAASFTGMAQSLENMQWFNEPEQWDIKGNTLSMEVTPQTDYWRISHYGFTVDDAPFLYTLRELPPLCDANRRFPLPAPCFFSAGIPFQRGALPDEPPASQGRLEGIVPSMPNFHKGIKKNSHMQGNFRQLSAVSILFLSAICC